MRKPCESAPCRSKPLRIKKIVQRLIGPIDNRTTVLTQNLNIPIKVVSSVKIFTSNVYEKTVEELFDATLHEVVPKSKDSKSKRSSTRIDVKLVKPLNTKSTIFRNKIYVTLKTKKRTEKLLTELYLIVESKDGKTVNLLDYS